MIEIIYDTEKEHIFDLRYELHKYIPESIFEKYPENTELHFIQDLFDVNSSIQFIGESPMIWSTHYIYKYMDKKTTQRLINEHLSGEQNRRLFIWSLLNFEGWNNIYG